MSSRFGESFPNGASSNSRIDPLDKELKRIGEKPSEENPDYIDFGLEIRSKLRSWVEQKNWPALPNLKDIENAEDFFESAKNSVDEVWFAEVEDLMMKKAIEWKDSLPDDNEKYFNARNSLADPIRFKQIFVSRQFGELSVLRDENPEAWRALIVASAERQSASIALVEHWLTDENNRDNLEKICQKIDLTPKELKLFVDTAAILGKYIDQAYVKQIELADLPGGSEETAFNDRQGSKYFYDLYKNGNDIDIKTYSEIFSAEWPRLVSLLNNLASKVRIEVKAGNLPETYLEYADYLNEMGNVYGLKIVDPDLLYKKWQDLYETAKKFLHSDCQIGIVPQGSASVAGDAGKIDTEIRLILRTDKIRNQERKFNGLITTAQEITDGYQNILNKPCEIPDINLSYSAWSFGPNLHWLTRAESNQRQISIHTNIIAEVALASEAPLLRKVFKNLNIKDVDYSQTTILETILHEIGHTILNSEDKNINEKIGNNSEADVIEELKAETVGMKILFEAEQKKKIPAKVSMYRQLLAKLGTNFDYLRNKSSEEGSDGERYFLCGVAIIGALLEKGLLVKKGDGYEITDSNACIGEIVAIGDEILSIYSDSKTKPKDVNDYVQKIRVKINDERIKEFIKFLGK